MAICQLIRSERAVGGTAAPYVTVWRNSNDPAGYSIFRRRHRHRHRRPSSTYFRNSRFSHLATLHWLLEGLYHRHGEFSQAFCFSLSLSVATPSTTQLHLPTRVLSALRSRRQHPCDRLIYARPRYTEFMGGDEVRKSRLQVSDKRPSRIFNATCLTVNNTLSPPQLRVRASVVESCHVSRRMLAGPDRSPLPMAALTLRAEQAPPTMWHRKHSKNRTALNGRHRQATRIHHP